MSPNLHLPTFFYPVTMNSDKWYWLKTGSRWT